MTETTMPDDAAGGVSSADADVEAGFDSDSDDVAAGTAGSSAEGVPEETQSSHSADIDAGFDDDAVGGNDSALG